MNYMWCCITLQLMLRASVYAVPLVTLKHGGQLQGRSVTYDGKSVDIFLGIRYAKPPVGALRFRKPEAADTWTGVIDATSIGSSCSQKNPFSQSGPTGSEDCLFLDITVPSGLSAPARKAVMIWIHGGGYYAGTGSSYLGAPITTYADVIIVTINYRLGIMGFLSDGEGTGNFGLWDQRQAIIWVNENIDRFGGDPNKITIFGQSAGAGSVSAQVMGQHNRGLFQRAIQQSGSLYNDWGWFLSEKRITEINDFLRQKAGCAQEVPVFECLKDKTLDEIEGYRSEYEATAGILTQWHPVPDNDFFAADVIYENYTFPTSVDLMCGFNGQEGAAVTMLGMFLKSGTVGLNTSLTRNGYTMDMAKEVILNTCQMMTPMSAKLCQSFLLNTYKITEAPDDRVRTVRISYALGETQFNADAIRQLQVHSVTDNSTYAYQFSNLFHSDNGFLNYPSWAKTSADHGEELPFVWGMLLEKEQYQNLTKAYFGAVDKPFTYVKIVESLPAEFKSLTEAMVTMWTNFARTGNPNKPMKVPNGLPAWPEFTSDDSRFMDLNTKGSKVTAIPNQQRIEKLFSAVFPARSKQVVADKVPVKACESDGKGYKKPGVDTVIG